MGRILAIDYGGKRTGLAVTDINKIIASPLSVVESDKLIQYLKTYFQSEQVDEIVLGFPKDLQGNETHGTALVKDFIIKFEAEFPNLKLHLWDERFTSKIAFQSMIQSGVSKKDRKQKGNIDKLSAVIILQEFMESR
jgi:putative holliday junction resolvase